MPLALFLEVPHTKLFLNFSSLFMSLCRKINWFPNRTMLSHTNEPVIVKFIVYFSTLRVIFFHRCQKTIAGNKHSTAHSSKELISYQNLANTAAGCDAELTLARQEHRDRSCTGWWRRRSTLLSLPSTMPPEASQCHTGLGTETSIGLHQTFNKWHYLKEKFVAT